jgi:hypothetical protein
MIIVWSWGAVETPSTSLDNPDMSDATIMLIGIYSSGPHLQRENRPVGKISPITAADDLPACLPAAKAVSFTPIHR